MAKLSTKEIRDEAVSFLSKKQDGIRFTELVREIANKHPESNVNTIFTQVSTLHRTLPDQVIKPSRGLFQLSALADSDSPPKEEVPEDAEGERILEKDFYSSFALYLKADLDEVTESEAFGGAGLKGKWGTPDVIGVYKPQAANLVKFPLEIVSAEIKTDPQQPVVAFGQAIAYRLFSHKTYIVMPTSLAENDQSRLESLCLLFGVGLVLFDLDVVNPNYSIRVRSQRFTPDMFYVNDFADRLRGHDPEAFERLFR